MAVFSRILGTRGQEDARAAVVIAPCQQILNIEVSFNIRI